MSDTPDTSTGAVNRVAFLLEHGDNNDCATAALLLALRRERGEWRERAEEAENKMISYAIKAGRFEALANDYRTEIDIHLDREKIAIARITELEHQLAAANRERERIITVIKKAELLLSGYLMCGALDKIGNEAIKVLQDAVDWPCGKNAALAGEGK